MVTIGAPQVTHLPAGQTAQVQMYPAMTGYQYLNAAALTGYPYMNAAALVGPSGAAAVAAGVPTSTALVGAPGEANDRAVEALAALQKNTPTPVPKRIIPDSNSDIGNVIDEGGSAKRLKTEDALEPENAPEKATTNTIYP